MSARLAGRPDTRHGTNTAVVSPQDGVLVLQAVASSHDAVVNCASPRPSRAHALNHRKIQSTAGSQR
eukprot:3062712-Rhodomonas_salina.2